MYLYSIHRRECDSKSIFSLTMWQLLTTDASAIRLVFRMRENTENEMREMVTLREMQRVLFRYIAHVSASKGSFYHKLPPR